MGYLKKRNEETEYVNKIINISEDVKWQMEQIWFCRATAGQVLIFEPWNLDASIILPKSRIRPGSSYQWDTHLHSK